jgi:hypothetical protein
MGNKIDGSGRVRLRPNRGFPRRLAHDVTRMGLVKQSNPADNGELTSYGR